MASASRRFSRPFSSSRGPEALGVRHAHPAELGLPGVDRALGYAVLARQLARFRAGLVLPQDPDDLLFRKSRSFHSVRPFKGRTLAPRGGNSQGHVNSNAEEAAAIPPLKARFDAVAAFRAESKAAQTRPAAAYPHRFRQAQNWAREHAILVPRVSSERRPYLPVVRVGSDVISSDLNQVLYDAPDWCIALVASRLHLVWIGTVCGRLESRFRYSNTLGWNTFPVPKFHNGSA